VGLPFDKGTVTIAQKDGASGEKKKACGAGAQ